MSLPAASAPVAVLVLAWDETTPAVRALVEATETAGPPLDSVVVLVPAGPATEELTPEEFLPLESSLPPSPETLPAGPADEPPPAAARTATEPVLPQPAATAAGELPAAAPSEGSSSLPATEAASAAPAPAGAAPSVASAASPAPPAALVSQPLPAPGVRTVRLSDYSLADLAAYARQALPAPTWVGSADRPAAPYLGSAAASAVAAQQPTGSRPRPDTTGAVAALPTAASPAGLLQGIVKEESTASTTGASPSYLPDELPAAPDAEPDSAALPAPDEAVPAIEASTTELSEEAAADSDESFAADVTPVQAGWPAALASLQVPAAYAEAAPPVVAAEAAPSSLAAGSLSVSEPEASAEPAPQLANAALLVATQAFEAPDLNFQIIQYARFAVPLALAAQPFAVVYAPAWPTWLAAQELRQRTGRPLVLHVATLAAADEPLELAAGWAAEIQRQALHRADLILTETPALSHRLRRELDLPAHRVRCVPAADAAAIAHALHNV